MSDREYSLLARWRIPRNSPCHPGHTVKHLKRRDKIEDNPGTGGVENTLEPRFLSEKCRADK